MKTRGVSSGLYFRTFQQLVPPPCNIESGGFGGVASLLVPPPCNIESGGFGGVASLVRSAGGSIILSIYCLASFRRPRYCSRPSIVWPISSGLVSDLYSGEATRISDVHACSSQSLWSASPEIFPCIVHTVPLRRAARNYSRQLTDGWPRVSYSNGGAEGGEVLPRDSVGGSLYL